MFSRTVFKATWWSRPRTWYQGQGLCYQGQGHCCLSSRTQKRWS